LPGFIAQNNDDIGDAFFPLRRASLGDLRKVIDWIDAERPAWNEKFWGDFGIALDFAWDFLLPAIAHVSTPTPKSAISAATP
jgi:hypothetical protein